MLLCPNKTRQRKLRRYVQTSHSICLIAFWAGKASFLPCRDSESHKLILRTSGSGLWMPEGQQLALLRNAINRKSRKIKQVLTSPAVRKSIFGGIPDDEAKAVKAFCNRNKESALKTKPKVRSHALLYVHVSKLLHERSATHPQERVAQCTDCPPGNVCLHCEEPAPRQMANVQRHLPRPQISYQPCTFSKIWGLLHTAREKARANMLPAGIRSRQSKHRVTPVTQLYHGKEAKRQRNHRTQKSGDNHGVNRRDGAVCKSSLLCLKAPSTIVSASLDQIQSAFSSLSSHGRKRSLSIVM